MKDHLSTMTNFAIRFVVFIDRFDCSFEEEWTCTLIGSSFHSTACDIGKIPIAYHYDLTLEFVSYDEMMS